MINRMKIYPMNMNVKKGYKINKNTELEEPRLKDKQTKKLSKHMYRSYN